MRQRRDSGSRFGAAVVAGVVLLCIALGGFTGCKDDPELSGENKITAFKIGEISAAIFEVDQAIRITVVEGTDLQALKPVITISADATVSPASEEAADFRYPVPYTVTAENGVTRTYTVNVYVEAKPEAGTASIEIGWPNAADKQPVIYGLPEKAAQTDPDIKLSVRGNNNLPKEIVISAGGRDGSVSVYDDRITWYVDGSAYGEYVNIITLYAEKYTLQKPHYITFIGTKDGVEYSATITFTVEK
jgi:hypothetical protein